MKNLLPIIVLFFLNFLILNLSFSSESFDKNSISPGISTIIFASVIGSIIGYFIGKLIKWFFQGFSFIGRTGDLVLLKLGFMFGFHIIASLIIAFFGAVVIQASLEESTNPTTKVAALEGENIQSEKSGTSLSYSDETQSNLIKDNNSFENNQDFQNSSQKEIEITSNDTQEQENTKDLRHENDLREFLSLLDISDVKKRAKKGEIEAQYQLGMMNKWGISKRKSKHFAKKWLKKAASKGHTKARLALESF